MIFYQTHGNQLAGTQADARAIDKNFTQIDVPVDKAGLMAFLNNLYAQIWAKEDSYDNPRMVSEPPTADSGAGASDTDSVRVDGPHPQDTPQVISYSERTIWTDEVFHNLPLAHQLSLAQVALENARNAIRCSPTGVSQSS